MGTNFYEALESSQGIITGTHIGKRSAAGAYCWDCRLTLCRGGEAMVHAGGRYFMLNLTAEQREMERAKEWFSECPRCHNKGSEETFENSAAGRELGFNKSQPEKKRGVASCSSFNWDMLPKQLEGIKQIVDEYGHLFTIQEFAQVLEECPIQFTDSIGREFS